VYHQGWAHGGWISNNPNHLQYGYHLQLKHAGAVQYGGPLFWAHYSFVALDPFGLVDKYADYGGHNTNHTLINRFLNLFIFSHFDSSFIKMLIICNMFMVQTIGD